MTGTANPRTLIVTGAASLAVRQPLTGPRRPVRVITASPAAVYLELPPPAPEPRVLILAAAGTSRPANAVVVAPAGLDRFGAEAGAAGAQHATSARQETTAGPEAWTGRGAIQAGDLTVHVMRWWDPSPVLGPLSRARLEQGAVALERACTASGRGPTLAGHDAPATLALCCQAGDLAGAVEAAERIVGLGPGLAPDGDNMINGLLLALRLLGGAIAGGTRAVWLADWLGAAVTSDAAQRTTSLGATLLHCAARGQGSAEVSAVLRGLAGQEPLAPAVRTLLTTAPPQGTDLAWGLIAGCRAALALAHPPR